MCFDDLVCSCSPLAIMPADSMSGPGQTAAMMGATESGQPMMLWSPQQGGQTTAWTQPPPPPPPWTQFMTPPLPGPEGSPSKECSPPVLLS